MPLFLCGNESIRDANAFTLTPRTALTAADVFFKEKSSRACEASPEAVIPSKEGISCWVAPDSRARGNDAVGAVCF
jgi:hypothetical protein